ncbi:hypothetical protein GCM10010307_00960 [Streptomyces vastus]|uniref:Histone deacetylase n=1 Tax=Streptomyces vastus TaxID=285451 RepID=A0ABP6CJL1_9ACTN
MLRNPGLRYPELPPDDLADFPGTHLPINQKLKNPPPHRVSEHIERVHTEHYITTHLYKHRLTRAAPVRGAGNCASNHNAPAAATRHVSTP